MKKEIRFRDGTVKLIDEVGNETTIFADGTEERKLVGAAGTGEHNSSGMDRMR
jgi:hypothetical protein